MKKLKNKLFYTILTILSLFSITILFIFNYQDYRAAKDNVSNNLSRIGIRNNEMPLRSDPIRSDNEPKLFMDTVLYTVILNGSKIEGVTSHNFDKDDTDGIYEVATDIIKKEKNSNIKIGNLYFNRYSYNYQKNIGITIIDNSELNNKLQNTLKLSILIFVILELIIIFTSKKLTDWIIKPVIEAFDKQKRFISDASHELKTPIAVILASSEALENNKDEPKWLDNIKEESIRMNKLVTNLLDLTRIENNTKFDYTNLSKLIEKSTLTLESLMYEKNIKLEYNIDDNISFKCNSDQMKQLITILLDNAIKHSDKKGIIKVNLKNNKDIITLEVINKGEPIKKGDEEKIFERFYRGDESRNRNQNRYGLGLAIAKSIVTNHNGKIIAYSKDGYTTFEVNLKKK